MTPSFCVKKTLVLFLSLAIMNPAAVLIPKDAMAGDSSPDSFKGSESKQNTSELMLYGGPGTRAPLVQWYLEELAVPYEYISLDLRADEHRQPEYLAINPMGKVPAIVDGNFKLWESGAILLYLAEKNGEIPDSIEGRSEINQWVIFANATLGPGLFREELRAREMPRLLTPLNQILEKQSFLLGADLSVADVAVGSYLHYARVALSLEYDQYPAVEAYLNRLSERPAFQKTLGQR